MYRMKKNIFIFTTSIFVLSITTGVFAMSSSNYNINSDSLNFGGTENSSSTIFIISDTFGEVGTGISSSTNYSLSAGYRRLSSSYISISAASDITLPSMSGIIAGESDSSESWTITTDNIAGYQLTIRSTSSPSLKTSDGASFSDYEPSVSNTPDYLFSVAPTSSTFAFSPEGTDISQKYLDNGASCNVGSLDTTNRCWDGFSVSDKIIAYRTSQNHPSGTNISIRYKSAIGSSKIQQSGTYTATIILTATSI